MTRAELAELLVQELVLERQDPFVNSFSDVKWYSRHYTAVETAAAYGLISGTREGEFLPDRDVSKEELLVILGRLEPKSSDAVIPAPKLLFCLSRGR